MLDKFTVMKKHFFQIERKDSFCIHKFCINRSIFFHTVWNLFNFKFSRKFLKIWEKVEFLFLKKLKIINWNVVQILLFERREITIDLKYNNFHAHSLCVGECVHVCIYYTHKRLFLNLWHKLGGEKENKDRNYIHIRRTRPQNTSSIINALSLISSHIR